MTREEAERTIGVFGDAEQAQQVAANLNRQGGDARVADPSDEVISLQAEMQDEMRNSWVSPQAAFIVNKEQGKGLLLVGGALTFVGALAGALVGLFPIFDIPVVIRVFIGAAVCGSAGFTIAIILGPGLASRGPSDAMAAEAGVTVSSSATPEARDIMQNAGPVRLDAVDGDGKPAGTLLEGDAQDLAGGVEAKADSLAKGGGHNQRP